MLQFAKLKTRKWKRRLRLGQVDYKVAAKLIYANVHAAVAPRTSFTPNGHIRLHLHSNNAATNSLISNGQRVHKYKDQTNPGQPQA